MDRGYIWSPSLATNSLMRMADWSFPRREAVSMTTTSGCVELPDIAERREAPVAPVDTSVAVALVVSDHQHHRKTVSSLRGRRLGLAGHAAFETFWVLTRRPPPLRRTPRAVQQLLSELSRVAVPRRGRRPPTARAVGDPEHRRRGRLRRTGWCHRGRCWGPPHHPRSAGARHLPGPGP